MPQWFERRTLAAPTPLSPALRVAISIALAATTMPEPFPPSRSALTGVSCNTFSRVSLATLELR